MRITRRSLFLLTLLALAEPATGHHGLVNFDLNKEIELAGTVTSWPS